MAVNLKVVKRHGESDEKLIRRFNRKCKKQKIVQEYREKTDHYIKPSITKRLKRQQAIREQKKVMRKEQEKLFRQQIMSDPKNKWTQPDAPPPPMFFGKNERDLVKQVNDELAERVVGQTVAYYSVSMEDTNFNSTYGEAIDKITLPPVRVFAYVIVENEQTNEKYGYDYQSKLTINFHRRRLVEDQNLFVRAGDFIQYGDLFYEIVKTYNDTRYYFGQVEHKFQVSAECVRARRGLFRVKEAITRPSQE